ncbi:MAG TPA: replicative DNA helicase [bacterium]|jgi:replicative DNA helicase|nr:replicative DNA helicase [bacterium]
MPETVPNDRQPPHNYDAEAAVLGACLLDPAALDTSLEILRRDDFFRGFHQRVFEAVADLHARSQPVDLVTVSDWMASRGLLEAAGGAVGLAGLTEKVASASNVEAYARLVKEKAKLRRLIAVCAQITQDCYTNTENAAQVVDTAENQVLDIGRQEGSQAVERVEKMMMGAIETIERYRRQGGAITGLPTGFRDIDELTSGLHPGQLIVAAGRPGSGKTAFALNIASNIAMNHAKPVVVYSLEMTKQELLFRLLCSSGSVDSRNLRRGKLENHEMGRLVNAATNLTKAPLYINDSSRLDIQSLRSSVRRMVKEVGAQLVVVDYLQLMHVEGMERPDRVREVTMISGALKAIAKEMNIPVLVASQLNRGVEMRQGAKVESKPRLSDLRESGSIEQDADVVMLIHRKALQPRDGEDFAEPDNSTDVIIAKQRSGPTGDVSLVFLGQYTRFEDKAPSGLQP